uniref:39S ribosomal protein L52, mitochondrial isoform X2 n=1 Tax=Myodes glareolus TaxID=447135 RepID=UPI002020D4F5|nr:39S ribosomal protein L52, mitochondrial isoform X2 [Myodes glareolus]
MSASGLPRSVARGHRGHAHIRSLCHGMAALGSWLSCVRRLHCSAAARAGGQWRLQQGLAANPSGYGPLTELPDWSFAETSCTADTGNGCWITGMEAQAAAVGGRKEAGTWSQTQGDFTEKSTSTSIKNSSIHTFPDSLPFFSVTKCFIPCRMKSFFPPFVLTVKDLRHQEEL